MVDPDAPSKKKSSKAQWLHWIVTNVEGRKVNNSVGWIVFVFNSFQPTPFLLGLVLSIGTSGSTEVGDHYYCFILRSNTSSLLCYHFDYQARDYSTMGIYKMLVGHSIQITDGDEVMMYAGPSPPKG